MTLAFLEGPDLIIVLVIVLVLFGGSKLPGLARSIGEAQREFRAGTQDGIKEAESAPAKQVEAPKPAESAKPAEANNTTTDPSA